MKYSFLHVFRQLLILYPLIMSNAFVEEEDSYGLLFSWHSFDGKIGSGSELQVALESARATHRDLPIYLMSNANPRDTLGDASVLDSVNVHIIDLMSTSGLYEQYLRVAEVDRKLAMRISCATKIQALLSGWEQGLLPRHVIHMDLDIVVLQRDSLYSMLEPLSHYDITGMQ